MHLFGLDWIRTSFEGSGVSGPWAFAWLAAALLLAPAWVIIVAATHALYYRLHLSMAVSLSLGWVTGDLARRAIAMIFTETDFLWLQLSATQTHFPAFVQVADVVGAYGVSGLIAYANGACVDILVMRGRQRMRAVASAAVLFGGVFSYGAWRLAQSDFRQGPSVCLMPPKMLPGTVDPSRLRGTEILLWPETTIRDDEKSDARQISELEQFANRANSCIAIGWYRKRPKFVANSLALVAPDGSFVAIYDKTYPAPWSEFTPWIEIPYVPTGRQRALLGNDHRTYRWADVRIAPAICYDVCFPAFFRRFDAPDLFLVGSREEADWTRRLPDHITQIVRLRAIEFRRSVVRNVRGGHSGVIDGCGRLLSDVVDLSEPTVVGPVPIDDRFSLYAKIGDTVLIVPFALVAAGCFYRRWRRSHGAAGSGDPATT